MHIPRVFPGIACSVAIPKVANAESVKSRMKMTCCSKYGQLIDREFMGEFAIRLPGLKGVGCRRAVDSLGRCASRDDGPACRDSLPRAKAQDGVRIARVGQRCVDTADRKNLLEGRCDASVDCGRDERLEGGNVDGLTLVVARRSRGVAHIVDLGRGLGGILVDKGYRVVGYGRGHDRSGHLGLGVVV